MNFSLPEITSVISTLSALGLGGFCLSLLKEGRAGKKDQRVDYQTLLSSYQTSLDLANNELVRQKKEWTEERKQLHTEIEGMRKQINDLQYTVGRFEGILIQKGYKEDIKEVKKELYL